MRGAITRCRDDSGRIICKDCGDLVPPGLDTTQRRTRCNVCVEARYLYTRVVSGQALCRMAVAREKKRGRLRPASEFVCADCGAPAAHYDHRDYNQPLAVEAVCHGCNLRRGPATPFNPYLVGLLLGQMAAATIVSTMRAPSSLPPP